MSHEAYGYTNLVCRPSRRADTQSVADLGVWQQVFIHEIGHGLGGNHNRQIPHAPSDGPRGSSVARSPAGYGVLINPLISDDPYTAFEYGEWDPKDRKRVELTEPYPDEENTGAYTIMAYKPAKHWLPVPFFSGGDLYEWGVGEHGLKSEDPDTIWVNGEYGVHDNAELFRQTTKDIAKLSDYQWGYPRMPEYFQAAVEPVGSNGKATVHFRWNDKSDNETSFTVVGVVYDDEDGIKTHLPPIWVPADSEDAIGRYNYHPGDKWAFWLQAHGPAPNNAVTPSEVASIGDPGDIAPPKPPTSAAVTEPPPAPTLSRSPDTPTVLMLVDGEFFNVDDGGKHEITNYETWVEKRQTGTTTWTMHDHVEHPWVGNQAFNYPTHCGWHSSVGECTHVEIWLESMWNPRLFDSDYRVTAQVTNAAGTSPKATALEFSGPPLPKPIAPDFSGVDRFRFLVDVDSNSFNGPGGGQYKITGFEYDMDRRKRGNSKNNFKPGPWMDVRTATGVPGDDDLDYPPLCKHGNVANRCINVAIPFFNKKGTILEGKAFDDATLKFEYRLRVRLTNRIGTSAWGEYSF